MSTAAPQLEQPTPQPQPLPFVIGTSDPLEWKQTPTSVATKIRVLRRDRDSARLVWRSLAEEQRAARENKKTAELRLRQIAPTKDDPWFVQAHSSIGPLPDDHPELVAVRERIERADAEITRLQPILDTHAHALDQKARVCDALDRYFEERLRGLKVIELFKLKGPPPVLKKGETPADAVARCRRHVCELKAARARVVAAPWHSHDALLRLREELDKISERGAPDVSALIQRGDGTVGWRERLAKEQVLAGRALFAEYDPNPFPLLVWLCRDLLNDRLSQAISSIARDEDSLTAVQRHEKLAQLDAESLLAARHEEFWVEEAISGGAAILRRADDCDPRAILNLADSLPPPSS